jgi:hypothetical protein
MLRPGLWQGSAVPWLTEKEQQVVLIVLALLLTGWLVRACRAAAPGPAPDGELNRQTHASS